MLGRVNKKTRATVRAQREMYKALTKLVLLYCSNIWLMTGEMVMILTAFHHQAARQITGTMVKRGAGGEWEYPLVEKSMESTGIHPNEEYTKRQKLNIAERVAWRPVYAL